jgi:hypothetical protein
MTQNPARRREEFLMDMMREANGFATAATEVASMRRTADARDSPSSSCH